MVKTPFEHEQVYKVVKTNLYFNVKLDTSVSVFLHAWMFYGDFSCFLGVACLLSTCCRLCFSEAVVTEQDMAEICFVLLSRLQLFCLCLLQTLSQSMRQADMNFEKLKTESERLEQHAKKSVNWLLWLMLILVSFTFISMILFIRIFPRLR